MPHARWAPSNHEKRVSLSRWRERVEVRVSNEGPPLTSILSPCRGEEVFGAIFYRIRCMDTILTHFGKFSNNRPKE